jgi:hypothetical protein
MPPKKQLAVEDVAILEQWIKDGAAWPQARVPASLGKPRPEYEALRKNHWAWQPLGAVNAVIAGAARGQVVWPLVWNFERLAFNRHLNGDNAAALDGSTVIRAPVSLLIRPAGPPADASAPPLPVRLSHDRPTAILSTMSALCIFLACGDRNG